MERAFIMPRQIISGAGALEKAAPQLGRMGKKALIVTGKVMVKIGNCAKVEEVLRAAGVDYTVYSEIIGEPTDVMIENGLRQYKEENCDFLVAIGGGSPIDSMKAIGALVESGGSICNFFGKTIDVKMPPMAAIPTTAGTGSEATQFTIITDTKRDIKMLLKGGVYIVGAYVEKRRKKVIEARNEAIENAKNAPKEYREQTEEQRRKTLQSKKKKK